MFSTNPRTGVWSLVNMKMAFSATLDESTGLGDEDVTFLELGAPSE